MISSPNQVVRSLESNISSNDSRETDLPGIGKVQILAADHARKAGGCGQMSDEHPTDRGQIVERVVFSQYLESERVQRVADEDRRCLIVRDVHGGAAATKIVVVHGRQIVVHERIGVNHLD